MFDYQLCILVDSIVQRAKGAQILGFPLSLANSVDCRLPFRKFRSSITRTFFIRVRTSVGKMGSKTRAGPGILKLKTGFSVIT